MNNAVCFAGWGANPPPKKERQYCYVMYLSRNLLLFAFLSNLADNTQIKFPTSGNFIHVIYMF